MFVFLLLPSLVFAQHQCWFEGFAWNYKAPSIPGVPRDIIRKIEKETGKEIDGQEQVLIIQMELPKNMMSYLLVAAKGKNEAKKYCFVGHAGHHVVFTFNIKSEKFCVDLFRKHCYNKGLDKNFMERFIKFLENPKKV